MKRFFIQAVCDEKVLWELMSALEQHHCTDILTRPVSNGEASPPKRRNGVPVRQLVVQVLRDHGKPMARVDLVTEVVNRGAPNRASVDGPLHLLCQRNHVRRTGPARYTLTKEGSTHATDD